MRAPAEDLVAKTGLVSVFPRVHYFVTKGWISTLKVKQMTAVNKYNVIRTVAAEGLYFGREFLQ